MIASCLPRWYASMAAACGFQVFRSMQLSPSARERLLVEAAGFHLSPAGLEPARHQRGGARTPPRGGCRTHTTARLQRGGGADRPAGSGVAPDRHDLHAAAAEATTAEAASARPGGSATSASS